jgi:type II secretory pathway pseudopilin PulG
MRGRVCFWRFGCRAGHGFVLVEVMVAALLAAFLLGPLATSMQSVVARARELRSDAADLNVLGAEGEEAAAWVWGPMVEAAVWDLGPELRVSVRLALGRSLLVGAWADGWSVGEWETDGASQLNLSAPIWSGLAGKELIIRVREPRGSWGPPWRTIVPDEWGALPGEAAAELIEGSVQGTSTGEERAILHVPAFGAPDLRTSWTMAPAGRTALGPAFALAASGAGWCEVELAARRQSWYAIGGRGLDVYY